MTERHERLVSSRELALVTIRCPQEEICGAELTFDLRKEGHRARLTSEPAVPICLICRTPFDSSIGEALKHVVAWYQLLHAKEEPLREIIFRVPEESS
jgi:hypothetical protein